MNTKQRNVIVQRWRKVIERESHDLSSLEQISKRALADSDVRDDSTLQSMIHVEVQKRRTELEQKRQNQKPAGTSPESRPNWRSEFPERPPSTTPEQDRESFNRLVETLSASLERGDEQAISVILGEMRTLQEKSPEVIPTCVIGEYEARVDKLRVRRQQLTDEIAVLARRACSAARSGTAQDLGQSMRRLTAIHTAHPQLLDESGLEDVRRDIVSAADERRQHQLTTKRFLEREGAITAEIKKLAAAVRNFHRVAAAVSETSDEFREAETTYLRTIEKVRTYDAEWFSDVVLEMADLLAEWTIPPPGAEGRIDRFLDSISTGLDRIRAEMREFETKRESDETGDSERNAH